MEHQERIFLIELVFGFEEEKPMLSVGSTFFGSTDERRTKRSTFLLAFILTFKIVPVFESTNHYT